MLELNKIYNMDCLEGLKLIKDKSVDLVLTDAPYGILQGKTQTGGGDLNAPARVWPEIDWDIRPSREVIKEILRVSKNQIIFGAEHLSDLLPQNRGWIVWDKMRQPEVNFAQAELIWTSFNMSVKIIHFLWNGFLCNYDIGERQGREHPTQKPQGLIRQLIKDYSKENDLILDIYMGSGTTAVACKQLNRAFLGFEIKKEYCEVAEKRLAQRLLNEF